MHLGFILKDLVDVFILGYVLYRGILLFAETRAIRLAYGIGVLILIYIIANQFNLTGLLGLFKGTDILKISVVVLAILFAPEIREALARLGTGARARFREQREAERKVIDEVVMACRNLAEKKVGAIIVLQREDGLEDFVRTGLPLDSKVSAPILESIFQTSSPLHDGAVVIKEDRLIAANCILPLSESVDIRREAVGTRHRAALGLAELRDAAVLVVSEERGTISLAESGKMLKYLQEKRLSNELMGLFVARMKRARQKARFNIRNLLFARLQWKLAAAALSITIWAFQAQDLEVVASISFGPGSRYPQEVRDIEDGQTVVLDPEEMVGRQLTLRGRNYRLYQVLYGLFRDAGYLDGKVRIKGIPDAQEEVQSRKLSLHPYGEDTPVGEEVDQEVAQQVILHNGGPRRRCLKSHASDKSPKPIFLHVGTVARIPKGSVGVLVYGALPRGFQAEKPVIDFKDPDDPLFCLEDDKVLMLQMVGDSETRPRIDISGRDKPLELKGVRLVLPLAMRGIALNRDGDVLRRIVVPIHYGGPPPALAEAKRLQNEVRVEAEAREAKAKEEMEEIAGQLLVLETPEFLKTLDLSRLQTADDSANHRLQEINRWEERKGVLLGEIQADQARIDAAKETAREGGTPEEIKEADEARKDAEILKTIRLQSVQHLDRYIASTEQWKEKLAEWVEALTASLEPVIQAREDVESREAGIKEARERLGVAVARAGAFKEGKRYRNLTRALGERLDSIKALPTDPVERIVGIASLFPSEVHAGIWRDLEKGLKDRLENSREIQLQIARVGERRAEMEEARFTALAQEKSRLAQTQKDLLVIEDMINIKGIEETSKLYRDVLIAVDSDHGILSQKLEALRQSLPDAEPVDAAGLEALSDALSKGLGPALLQAETEARKMEIDLDQLETQLARLSGDAPDEAADSERLSEEEAKQLKDYRGYETKALRELKGHLEKREEILATRIGTLHEASSIAEVLVSRSLPSTGASSPPGAVKDKDGETSASDAPSEAPR